MSPLKMGAVKSRNSGFVEAGLVQQGDREGTSCSTGSAPTLDTAGLANRKQLSVFGRLGVASRLPGSVGRYEAARPRPAVLRTPDTLYEST